MPVGVGSASGFGGLVELSLDEGADEVGPGELEALGEAVELEGGVFSEPDG